MTKRGRLAWVGAATALGLLLSAGCNPAGRYGQPPSRSDGNGFKLNPPEKAPVEPKKDIPPPPATVPPDYIWMPADEKQMEPQVPIVFVTEHGTPFEWNKLARFWTYEPPPPAPAKPPAGPAEGAKPGETPAKPAKPAGDGKPAEAPAKPAPPAAPPMPAAQGGGKVKIKVPRGLPDPLKSIPASNLPTVGKWELGKRLFFDDSYLADFPRQSCASCHRPEKGFTEARELQSPRVSPLLNVVYNRSLFWDGRARALEEVVQRQPADELPPPNMVFLPAFQHTWSGVIKRLRDNPEYRERFMKVFGTPPTQDTVGKALATYLRTLLTGDSIYDRAEAALEKRKAQTLDAADFAEALKGEGVKDETIKSLDGDPAKKDELAKRLAAGAKLYHDAACLTCHPGPTFHDNSFHNLGIGDSAGGIRPGHESGRFAALPVGEKDPNLIGAFKTPTLRALPQTGPYFHDASRTDLFEVVVAHVRVGPAQVKDNAQLDPLLRDEKDPSKGRDLHLKEDDIRALVVFLKALDGAIDPVVRERDNWPEGTKPPPKP